MLWQKSKDLGILDFNRFVKNWISTDKFFFNSYKMDMTYFEFGQMKFEQTE